MKFRNVEIVGGPNWAFYAITGWAVYAAISEASWTPIWWWCGFLVISLAIGMVGIWLNK